MSITVLVPVADGIEELEAVAVINILRRAGARVVVAGITDKTVTAARGVKLIADKNLLDCMDASYDLIALPGGIPGVEHLKECKELVDLLKQQFQTGKLIGAICAAPQVVLAFHGILENQRATGHPAFTGNIANKESLDQRVVVDNNLVTSRGAGTAVEFALKLVELLFGRAEALKVADAILAGPGII
jgi:4-methyl-5(b-hydroxyethyl)-thiazole monophosphate biosynthesis